MPFKAFLPFTHIFILPILQKARIRKNGLFLFFFKKFFSFCRKCPFFLIYNGNGNGQPKRKRNGTKQKRTALTCQSGILPTAPLLVQWYLVGISDRPWSQLRLCPPTWANC